MLRLVALAFCGFISLKNQFDAMRKLLVDGLCLPVSRVYDYHISQVDIEAVQAFEDKFFFQCLDRMRPSVVIGDEDTFFILPFVSRPLARVRLTMFGQHIERFVKQEMQFTGR